MNPVFNNMIRLIEAYKCQMPEPIRTIDTLSTVNKKEKEKKKKRKKKNRKWPHWLEIKI